MRAPTNDEEQKARDETRAKERGEMWFASGRGVFCLGSGFQMATVAVAVNWQEDTARVVALLNAGQACVDWARDTGECHLCSFDGPAGRSHDEDCPLRKLT